jgi:hypothetical protein
VSVEECSDESGVLGLIGVYLQRPRFNGEGSADSRAAQGYYKESFFEDPWRHLVSS